MENVIRYRVLVKYVDSLGRERRYDRYFDDYETANRYFRNKYDKACRCCDIYLYRIYKKQSTTFCDVLRNAFVG